MVAIVVPAALTHEFVHFRMKIPEFAENVENAIQSIP